MPESADIQTIQDVVDRYITAEREGDVETMRPMLTDDFAGIGPVGFMLDKSQWIARHETGELTHNKLEIEDVAIRTYGSTAVVTVIWDQDTVARGHANPGRFRVAFVLRRDGDAWQFANAQLSGPMMNVPPQAQQQAQQ